MRVLAGGLQIPDGTRMYSLIPEHSPPVHLPQAIPRVFAMANDPADPGSENTGNLAQENGRHQSHRFSASAHAPRCQTLGGTGADDRDQDCGGQRRHVGETADTSLEQRLQVAPRILGRDHLQRAMVFGPPFHRERSFGNARSSGAGARGVAINQTPGLRFPSQRSAPWSPSHAPVICATSKAGPSQTWAHIILYHIILYHII